MAQITALREQQKREVRQRLYEVALKLFRRQGFDTTTVEQITKETGVAKGTFFNYFPSKESLLSSFMREETNAMIAGVIKRESRDARKALRWIAEGLAALGTLNTDLMLPFAEIKFGDSSLRDQERQHDDEIRKTILGLLENDRGVDPEWCRKEGQRFTEIILANWTGTIHEWRLSGGKMKLRDSLLARLEMLLRLLPVR